MTTTAGWSDREENVTCKSQGGALVEKLVTSERASPFASGTLMMADRRSKDHKDFVQRAKRFAVAIPVRYRRSKSAEWREGTTVNISASGILVRASDSSKPPATLDFALALPVVAQGEPGAEIRCHGSLVREVEDADHEETIFAVSIGRYRIVRKRFLPFHTGPKSVIS